MTESLLKPVADPFKEFRNLHEWKEKLLNGFYFVKHHKWGSAKLRFVWLTDDLDCLQWSAHRSMKPKGTIFVKDILYIEEDSKIGKSYPSKLKKAQSEANVTLGNLTECTQFSIVAKGRCLNLEAPTIDASRKWKRYFEQLIQHSSSSSRASSTKSTQSN